MTAAALVCGFAFASACGDDDFPFPLNPVGGAGAGGRAAGGTGGSAGAAGAGGAGGAGGASMGGAAGAGGGSAAATGTITALSADAAGLNTPTTGAIRGTDLWVANGQLTGLLGGAAAVPPFNVVSIPLAGGPIGATPIVLAEADFYPEGVAAGADGTLYVGSFNLGIIVRVPANSTTPETTPFVAATVSQRGVVGLTVDTPRSTLWFCDSSPATPGGALVGVNLTTGAETVRHELGPTTDGIVDAGVDAGDVGDAGAAPAAFCNDVVVSGAGVIFVTDSSGRIFRILAADVEVDNSAQVWLEHSSIAPPVGGFGANGLDFVGNRLVVSNVGTGALVSIDPASNDPASTVDVITLTEGGMAATLCGPDGLQAVPNTSDLIVVENGLCTTNGRERVVRIALDLE